MAPRGRGRGRGSSSTARTCSGSGPSTARASQTSSPTTGFQTQSGRISIRTQKYQDFLSQNELESDTVIHLSPTPLEDFCVGGISPRISPNQRRKQRRSVVQSDLASVPDQGPHLGVLASQGGAEQSDHQDVQGNSQQAGGSGMQAGVSSQGGRGGGVNVTGSGRAGVRRRQKAN